MNIDIDASDARRAADELARARQTLPRNTEKAVALAAKVGKDAWRADASAKDTDSLSAYPYAIDYDRVKSSGGEASTEIGPVVGKGQGSLAIVEDAPGGVDGPAQRNYERAEREAMDDLEVGITKMLDDLF